MSIAIAILACIFIVLLDFMYETQKTNSLKKDLMLKVKEKHLKMRKQMIESLSHFNREYASWMYYRYVSDQTPMSLIYSIQYKDMLKYRENWQVHFEKQCIEEINTVNECKNRKNVYFVEEKLLTSQ